MSEIKPKIEDGVPYGTRKCPSWKSRNGTRKDSLGHSGKRYCSPLCEVTGGCCGWICLPYVRQMAKELAAAQADVLRECRLEIDAHMGDHKGLLTKIDAVLAEAVCRAAHKAMLAAPKGKATES